MDLVAGHHRLPDRTDLLRRQLPQVEFSGWKAASAQGCRMTPDSDLDWHLAQRDGQVLVAQCRQCIEGVEFRSSPAGCTSAISACPPPMKVAVAGPRTGPVAVVRSHRVIWREPGTPSA
jgi:hypothetical protein